MLLLQPRTLQEPRGRLEELHHNGLMGLQEKKSIWEHLLTPNFLSATKSPLTGAQHDKAAEMHDWNISNFLTLNSTQTARNLNYIQDSDTGR